MYLLARPEGSALALTVGLIAAASAAAVAVVLLTLRHVLQPRLAVRRRLKEERALQNGATLVWSDHGYAVRGETVSSDVPWNHFVRWRENSRVILLYHSHQVYQFVPKGVLPPGAGDFIRDRLQAAGVPRVGLFLS